MGSVVSLNQVKNCMTLQDHIENITSKGLSVFPIVKGQKSPAVPKWEIYRSEITETHEIEEFLAKGHDAYGIPCKSPVDADIMVVDIDAYQDKEGCPEDKLPEIFKDDFVVRTGKGFHIYKKIPYGNKITNFAGLKMQNWSFDIRGNAKGDGTYGGGYVLGPGSRHPNGSYYKLINDVPMKELDMNWWEKVLDSNKKRETGADKISNDIDVMLNMVAGETQKGKGQGVYDINLREVGKIIHSIKDLSDMESMNKGLQESIAFNSVHKTGYPQDKIVSMYKSIYKKELASRADKGIDETGEKMSERAAVEYDLKKVYKAGLSLVTDANTEQVYIQINGRKNVALDSIEGKRWLIQTTTPPTQGRVSNLLMRLDAQATDAPKISLLPRVAPDGKDIVYNLGRKSGETIRVSREKKTWEIQEVGTKWFVSPAGELPQVTPIAGGNVMRIFEFANINKEHRELFVCLMIAYFLPDIDYPIMYIHGEKGSGKSTAALFVKHLVDPNGISLESSINQQDIREAKVALSSSYLTVLDNISFITQGFSDLLATAATGGGFRDRQLHTNKDVVLTTMKKPIIITAVNQEAKREDLLSRLILFEVDRLPQTGSKQKFAQRFREAKPEILGGIFDVLAKATLLPEDEKNLIRMSDFHMYCRAFCRVLGFDVAKVDALLQENYQRQESESVEQSDEMRLIKKLLKKQSYEIINFSAGDIYDELNLIDSSFSRRCKSPALLGKTLNQLKGSAETAAGIIIRKSDKNKRNWDIVQQETKVTLNEEMDF